MTSSKKVKCGACGGAGHNRGNYTATTCPSYYDEAELQLRKKKKGMEERKQRVAQQKIEEIERTNATGTEKIEQIQTLLSDVQRNQQAQESVAASEVKRLKQVKARAEKRAGKL
jgi:Fic family protein